MHTDRYLYAYWAVQRYARLGEVERFAHNKAGQEDSLEIEVFSRQVPIADQLAVSAKLKLKGPNMGW